MINNYFINSLKIGSKIRMFLPYHINPDRYLTITIQGMRDVVFVHDDLKLNQSTRFLVMQLHNLKKIYGKEYLFTEPQLSIKSNPLVFELKIGILRKKEYDKKKQK